MKMSILHFVNRLHILVVKNANIVSSGMENMSELSYDCAKIENRYICMLVSNIIVSILQDSYLRNIDSHDVFLSFILQTVYLNLTLDKKFMLLTHIQGAQNILVVLAVKESRLVSHQSSQKRAMLMEMSCSILFFSSTSPNKSNFQKMYSDLCMQPAL